MNSKKRFIKQCEGIEYKRYNGSKTILTDVMPLSMSSTF